MVGVDLGGDDGGFAVVDEGGPAVDAVPVLTEAGAVGEDDFDGDGKDEVAFAVEMNCVAVLDLRGIFRWGKPPLDWVGAYVVDDVVQYLSAVDGLIKEGAKRGVGDGGGGVVREAGWA